MNDPRECVWCSKVRPGSEFRDAKTNRCKRCSLELKREEARLLIKAGLCTQKCGRKLATGTKCRECADKDVAKACGHGVQTAQYNEMLAAQGGCCAICRTTKPGGQGDKYGRFHVDHDHATGVVRGLLCQRCNVGLGFFLDDSSRLRAAIGYLERVAANDNGAAEAEVA